MNRRGFLAALVGGAAAALLPKAAPQVGALGQDYTIEFWAKGAFSNRVIDELRVTVGVARYTSDFTPPEMAWPTDGEWHHVAYTRTEAYLDGVKVKHG